MGSAGLDRVLRKSEHFAAFLGSEVEVKLYRARDGKKDCVGVLKAYDNGAVTLECGGETVTFEKKDIAQVRLYVRF